MNNETIHRYRKARKVVDYLRANGVQAIIAEDLNDYFRAAIADLAQVNAPSDDTWALIEYLLAEAAGEV